MKIVLYVIGAICFIGPIIFWAFLSSLACAYVTSATACSASLDDFLDWEFFNIAILPWAIALMCFISGYRRASKNGN